MAKNHQTIEQLERDGAHHRTDRSKLFPRRDCVRMFPAPRPRSSGPNHISSGSRFADVDSEHQQLPMDSRRSPRRILLAHAPDWCPEFAIDPRPSSAPPRLPAPIRSKPATMPPEHGLRLDDDHCVRDRREESALPDQNQTIDVPQVNPLSRLAAQYQQLLA